MFMVKFKSINAQYLFRKQAEYKVLIDYDGIEN